ncbi:MAG: MBL fold metallo-hydrolase [Armatimonadota bacterium]|nr:MBL fold metallo-hydrolase [bacterium]
MSLEFSAIEVGMLQVNCYLIWDTPTRKAAIIDPGDDTELIIGAIKTLNLDVERVLLTHGHFDHAFRAGEIASHYGVRIGMNALDLPILGQILLMGKPFFNVSEYVPFDVSDFINEGDVITLGGSKISVLHTPGHSQGGLCYVTESGVFCGDTIFAGSVGRSDMPGGSHEQLIESIKTKLMVLDDTTPLYPGHGPATSVGRERRTNPFL